MKLVDGEVRRQAPIYASSGRESDVICWYGEYIQLVSRCEVVVPRFRHSILTRELLQTALRKLIPSTLIEWAGGILARSPWRFAARSAAWCNAIATDLSTTALVASSSWTSTLPRRANIRSGDGRGRHC